MYATQYVVVSTSSMFNFENQLNVVVVVVTSYPSHQREGRIKGANIEHSLHFDLSMSVHSVTFGMNSRIYVIIHM